MRSGADFDPAVTADAPASFSAVTPKAYVWPCASCANALPVMSSDVVLRLFDRVTATSTAKSAAVQSAAALAPAGQLYAVTAYFFTALLPVPAVVSALHCTRVYAAVQLAVTALGESGAVQGRKRSDKTSAAHATPPHWPIVTARVCVAAALESVASQLVAHVVPMFASDHGPSAQSTFVACSE
jgi:hypothetical protein